MAIPLNLRDAFESEQALGDMIAARKVCFDHDPFYYPEPPMHRIIYSPERRYRAEVCLQVTIFDRGHYGVMPDRSLEELRATAECLLRRLGAKRGT